MSSIVAGLTDEGLVPAAFWPVGRNWVKEWSRLKAKLKDIDAVIVNGEGTIHGDDDRQNARLLVCLAGAIREYRDIPVILINSSLYNLTGKAYRELAAYSRIYVRDTASLNSLARHAIAAAVVPDLSLTAPRADEAPQELVKRSGILISDSVAAITSERLSEARAVRGDYSPMMRPLLRSERLRRKTNYLTSGFSSVCGKPVGSPLSYIAYLQKVWKSSMLFSGRYHAVCFALRCKTPFLAISSNTPKVEWLLDDALGSRNRLVSLDHLMRLGESDLVEEFAFSPAELESLDYYLASARLRRSQMFREIRGLAHGSE